MKGIFYYLVELRRLLQNKTVWLTTALCLCAPILGYTVYKPVATSLNVMSGVYIGNPVLAAATVGAVFWAIVTLYESSRMHRSRMDEITGATASPVRLAWARLGAMLTCSALAGLLCAATYLPYTAYQLDYLFHGAFYIGNYLVFLVPTWWISILFAEGFYQITRRVELSAILYAMLGCFSFSRLAETDYFMRWLNPYVTTFSDGFPSLWPLRIGLYTRLIWLSIALAVWMISLVCIRKYGRSLPASALQGLRNGMLPVLSLVFALSGTLLWYKQPFIDHGPETYVDNEIITSDCELITRADYAITVNPLLGTASVHAEYQMQFPHSGESVLKLNPGYRITSMTYDGTPVSFRTVDDDCNDYRSTYFTLPEDLGKTLVIEYGGFPTIPNYTADYMVSRSINPDFIAFGFHGVMPQFQDYSCLTSDVAFTLPDTLTPYLNYARMEPVSDNADGTRTWQTTDVPYLQDLTAADYVTETISAAGTEIDFMYGRAYTDIVKEQHAAEAICDVFDYCTVHYGELEFVDGKHLLLMQQSAAIMGGYALPGMSQWFEAVLSPDSLKNTENGANANEIFIHEMIHQWWGAYGVRFADDGLWSSEGLTVYATYRLVKEKYGALYAQQYYVDVWEQAVEKQDRSFYNRHPDYLDRLPDRYRGNLIDTNQNTNLYQRMPLMLLKAEQLVGGEEQMDAILARIYADRAEFTYDSPLTYEKFLSYCGLTEEALRLD